VIAEVAKQEEKKIQKIMMRIKILLKKRKRKGKTKRNGDEFL